MLRAARRLGASAAGDGDRPPSSAPMRCRRNIAGDADALHRRTSAASSSRPSRGRGLADAVDAFCERIAFSPEQMARVFDAAKAHGLAGEAPRRAAFQSRRRQRWRRATARCRPITWNISTRTASRRWRRPGRSPCCCPAPSISCARRSRRRSTRCARHGVPIALATDCNPGTSPLTSLLLAMNMAATLFGMTRGGMPARRDA